MDRIPIQMFQARDNGMIRIPPGHTVIRQNAPQKRLLRKNIPDKPVSHTILVTSGLGDNLPLIQGYPELSKPRSRSLRKYKSDKPGPSRETALSVMRTSRKGRTSGKERTSGKGRTPGKGKSKKRPSDKGETRKDKKAKARKKQGKQKQGKKKRRRTKRRTSKKII